MADFDKFLPLLLKNEGGWVNHRADRGGPTNRGITFAVFTEWSRPLLKIEGTIDNLKQLTIEQAARLYKVLYWNKVRAGDMEPQWLANMVCDFYVHNQWQGASTLQRVINRQNHTPRLKVDGSIGPLTITALRKYHPPDIYVEYRFARAGFYESLQFSHAPFIKGWRNRLARFPETLEDV
jgi:type VI secretion system secreted protein VgrG